MQNLKEITNELTTIRDYLRWGISQFLAANLYFGHGTDNAWDEAVFLILHALHLPHDIDKSILDAKLTMHEREKVVAILWQRVKERKPAAYLTNTAYFANLEFYVDERVLIPRSPLAELIEKQFVPWIEPQNVTRILDIGTGCGCFAIACAFAFPNAKIDAVDVSNDALEVAKINIAKHEIENQVRLVQSNLFAELSYEKYDIIISNPPYVAVAEMHDLPQEYMHEPKLALAAGEAGLDIINKLLFEAKNHLNANGILVVEIGNSAPALIEKYPKVPFIWLEFERGESEVFLLTFNDLKKYFG